jgi:hypothetical protein
MSASEHGCIKHWGFSVFSAVTCIRILPFQVDAISGFEFISFVIVPVCPRGDPYTLFQKNLPS